jgi:hypothetical protein
MTMSSNITPYDAGAEVLPIAVQSLMGEALHVFQFGDDLEEAFGLAHCAADLVRVENGKFIALQGAMTREARFRVHCDAHEIFDELPSNEILLSAYRVVQRAMAIRPTEDDLAQLVGKALDIWFINSEVAADYGQALVWKLSDCPKQRTEGLFHRRKRWLSVPAVAGAFNHLLDSYRPAYGKPPPIPDVLEECGRQSDRLIRLHDEIDQLGRTQALLGKVIKRTEDAYPKEDDAEDVPFSS